jgi:hypothetical protein
MKEAKQTFPISRKAFYQSESSFIKKQITCANNDATETEFS